MRVNQLDIKCGAQQVDLDQIQIVICNKDIRLQEVYAYVHWEHVEWEKKWPRSYCLIEFI